MTVTFRDDQWSMEHAALRRRVEELEAENNALRTSSASNVAVLQSEIAELKKYLATARKVIEVLGTSISILVELAEEKRGLAEILDYLTSVKDWIVTQKF